MERDETIRKRLDQMLTFGVSSVKECMDDISEKRVDRDFREIIKNSIVESGGDKIFIAGEEWFCWFNDGEKRSFILKFFNILEEFGIPKEELERVFVEENEDGELHFSFYEPWPVVVNFSKKKLSYANEHHSRITGNEKSIELTWTNLLKINQQRWHLALLKGEYKQWENAWKDIRDALSFSFELGTSPSEDVLKSIEDLANNQPTFGDQGWPNTAIEYIELVRSAQKHKTNHQ